MPLNIVFYLDIFSQMLMDSVRLRGTHPNLRINRIILIRTATHPNL